MKTCTQNEILQFDKKIGTKKHNKNGAKSGKSYGVLDCK